MVQVRLHVGRIPPTKQERSVPSAMDSSTPHPDYVLSFLPKRGRAKDGLSAVLTSPLLDRSLHPRRTAKIGFGNATAFGCKGRGHLDSFQLGSLGDYVSSQTAVVLAIEAELMKVRCKWLPEVLPLSVHELWKTCVVEETSFDPIIIQTRDSLQFLTKGWAGNKLGLTEEDVDRILARSDRPDIKSKFDVRLKTVIDEDQHRFLASFRDGELLEFSTA